MLVRILGLAMLITTAGAALTVSSTPVSAQGASCYALWFERNEIYARNGYCFKSDRAIAEFGRGCFPPYGRLTGWEARRVRQLQDMEYARGCPQ